MASSTGWRKSFRAPFPNLRKTTLLSRSEQPMRREGTARGRFDVNYPQPLVRGGRPSRLCPVGDGTCSLLPVRGDVYCSPEAGYTSGLTRTPGGGRQGCARGIYSAPASPVSSSDIASQLCAAPPYVSALKPDVLSQTQGCYRQDIALRLHADVGIQTRTARLRTRLRI